MKKNILFIFSFLNMASAAQKNAGADADYNLFISGGFHVSVWSTALNQQITPQQIPYNVHIDKLFKDKYVLGLGYTYDLYPSNPFVLSSYSGETHRHNVRVRYYKYLMPQERTVSLYIGMAVGISYWASNNTTTPGYIETFENYLPSAQFIFGIKLKFSETFFWQNELGGGSPYAFQSSLGIKF